MCDIRTVKAVESWAEVGERVRQARIMSELSQAELAGKLDIDRSALAKIESGQRQVTALELFRLSDSLGVPIGHFVTRPPTAVTSRRQELNDDADQVTKARFQLDAALEAHARDAEWLAAQGFLLASPITASADSDYRFSTSEGVDPQAAAQALRSAVGLRLEPIPSMADVCGRAGLHVLVLPELQAGASLTLEPGLGVAVVGGMDQPGRRRFTAAHELGHFVLQDEYTTDIGVAASRDEREQAIDAFASEFVVPADAVLANWERLRTLSERQRLVHIAATYRVSWSVALRKACKAGLIDDDIVRSQLAKVPGKGDFLEVLGQEPLPDLMPRQTSPQWVQASMAAWRSGTVTAARALELLHQTIAAADLPDREEPDPA